MTDAVCAMPWGGKVRKDLWQKALDYVSDDLDTPKVLALVWEIMKDSSVSPADKKATILKIDELLGLAKADESAEDATQTDAEIPTDVQTIMDERAAARAAKDWKKSDELRDKIAAMGYEVKDTAEGQKIRKI